jgi:hypothetical protein
MRGANSITLLSFLAYVQTVGIALVLTLVSAIFHSHHLTFALAKLDVSYFRLIICPFVLSIHYMVQCIYWSILFYCLFLIY